MTAAAVLDSSAARKAMIDSQLRVSGVSDDWLLALMGRVPREDHVPAAARGHAYIDRAIPLDGGRALPAPLSQARLLALAAPGQDDKALLVSCGSSYMAALLEPLVGSLTVLDAAEAAGLTQGAGNHTLLIIDGAIGHLPQGLVDQLGEGGRVVTGVIDQGVSRLAQGTRNGGAVNLHAVAEIGIPALPEFAAPKSWSF